MFEVIEDTHATVPAEAVEHIKAVFQTAKQLKAKKETLVEEERERRKKAALEKAEQERREVIEPRRVLAYEVKGVVESIEQYKENLRTLEAENVALNQINLSIIRSQKQELENRLTDLSIYQEGLVIELQTLEQTGLLLQDQSQEYAEKLASGDIAAADILENNRKSQLQDNHSQKQAIDNKIEGIRKAESIINADIAIYTEMEKIAHNSLLLSQYKSLEKIFDEELKSLTVAHKEMDNISYLLWGDHYHKWEHFNKLETLVNDSKDEARKREISERVQRNQDAHSKNPKFFR